MEIVYGGRICQFIPCFSLFLLLVYCGDSRAVGYNDEESADGTPERTELNETLHGSLGVWFIPPKLSVLGEGESALIEVHVTPLAFPQLLSHCECNLSVEVKDDRILMPVMAKSRVLIQENLMVSVPDVLDAFPNSLNVSDMGLVENSTVLLVEVTAKRLGKTTIRVVAMLKECPDESVSSPSHVSDYSRMLLAEGYEVIVVRFRGLVQRIFLFSLLVLAMAVSFCFGCKLEVGVMKEIMKRPVAPAIGFLGQFLLMPLIGLCISQVFNMGPVFGFGLLALACSPGGNGSNKWTLLMGGDINLSLVMTFFSLVCSLGMMPLWLFLLSRLYFDPSQVRTPYVNIVITISKFVGPCVVGVLFRRFFPVSGKKLARILKPLSIMVLLWMLGFGSYANAYMFRFVAEKPGKLAVGVLLPWCGFLFGFLMATLLRQPRPRALTIAIETGLQNAVIPIIMLQQTFPQPEGDLSAIIVLVVVVFAPVPLYIWLIARAIRKRCFHDNQNTLSDEPCDNKLNVSGTVGELEEIQPTSSLVKEEEEAKL